MKVKIFCYGNAERLEKEINKFIENKKIIDIKFTTCTNDDFKYNSAMILYDEKGIGDL